MPHQDHARLADPRESAVEQDELGLGVRLDQVDQEHRVGSLDARLAGVDLKRQVVAGAQLDEPPHDEVLEVADLLGGELAARWPQRLGGAVRRDVLEPQRPLVGERRLEADRPGVLGLLEQPVEHLQVIVERSRPASPRCAANAYGSSDGLP